MLKTHNIRELSQICQLFWCFQLLYFKRRRLRFEKKQVLELHLNGPEGHLLHDVLVHPGTSSTEFLKDAGLHKSLVSRTVERLRADELITVGKNKSDDRIKPLFPTKRGEKVFSEMITLESEIIKEILGSKQFHSETKILNQFIDLLRVKPWTSHRDEHSFLSVISRFSRAFSLFNKKLLATEFDLMQFAILKFLKVNAGTAQIEQLREFLTLDTISVTKLITPLRATGLIEDGEKSLEDKRKKTILLTENGRNKLLQAESSMAKAILEKSGASKLYGKLPIRWLEQLAGSLANELQLEIRRETKVKNLSALRKFFLEEACVNNELHLVQSQVFHSESECYGVFIGNLLKGCLEMKHGEVIHKAISQLSQVQVQLVQDQLHCRH